MSEMQSTHDRSRGWLVGVVVAVVILSPGRPVLAQDDLSAARALYASARYEEALVVLDRLRADKGESPENTLTLEKYRALCLVALGRESEAESAFADVVAVDPTYLPEEEEVSPRVRAFFREVRRRMLPEIVRARYAEAKAAYDRGEYPEAVAKFQGVVALLDDEDIDAGLRDLREVAVGFQELSAAKAPPPLPAPEPPPAPEPAPAPADKAPEVPVYDAKSPGVTPPATVVQTVPSPPAEVRLTGSPRGLYELLIDEQGRVASVVVKRSIQEAYDRRFMAATSAWRYEPAYLNGRPVRYRKLIQVTVQ
jgi:tetratricopeptide (TPR) repeat protein